MELDSVLLIIRQVFHLGIFLGIASYQPHGARQRWGVSVLATALAASNFGLFMGLLTGAFAPKLMGPQWLYLVAFGSLFMLIVLCRGNLAKLVPRPPSSKPT